MKRILSAILIMAWAAGAMAARTETIDGVPHVANGAASSVEMETVTLNELFRVGGEDDEIFFGVVGGTMCDPDGNLYVLDGQQSEVQMYSPEGEWLRTLSRQGEGPGEINRPDGMYMDQAGNICMFQGPMGRLVRIDGEGVPVGDITYDPNDGTSGGLKLIFAGHNAGDGMILGGLRIIFGQTAVSNNHYFLVRCDAEGKQIRSIEEKDHFIDYSDFHLSEIGMDFVFGRWAADDEGRVYIARDRNEYRIEVLGPTGELERVITRDYKSLRRNAQQRTVATQIIEGISAYHGTPLLGLDIEDTEPDIIGMRVDDDGYLWVRTSRGENEKPEGVFTVMDVFAPDGEFVKQVGLKCSANPEQDALTFLEDGRVLVVVSSLDAWLTQQRVARESGDADVEEAPPLEVIVYEMK
ncbi:MAG: hypothetical protein GY835_26345 [bacterium]|nr:hypothetical protein [bacterium]